MSRRYSKAVPVVTDPDGTPLLVAGHPVWQIAAHWREWIGALEGERERDIWRVLTKAGILELHHLHPPEDLTPQEERSDTTFTSSPSAESLWLLASAED